MATSDNIMPEQEALSLRFKDKDLESQFHESYDKGVRLPLRYGMFISILAWVASIVLVSFVIPDQFVHLITLTSSIILSVFVLIAYTTYNKAFGGYYHILGAFSNAWAGLFAIYFCHQFPTGENLTLPVLIFIIFFGSYMIRLRWIAGCVAALTYTIGYHVYITLYTDLSSEQVIQYAFVAWLTLLFAILAGRVAEYNNRLSFVQRKTIREQGVIIEREKEASEKLLANMLPPFIAKRLKEDQAVIADNHNDASVLFADLVGFTELSSKLPARKLVDILNHVFSKFDALTERHELEKIKTIGDGYMVAGGLTKNKVDHLTRMANLSLEMIEFLKSDTQIKELNLKIRIGINSGNVIAGVIGIKKYTYDLWGDTVNTASRMESQGEIGRVHVSEVVKLRLDSNFDFEKRDIINIKGKGDAQTYLLLGKK